MLVLRIIVPAANISTLSKYNIKAPQYNQSLKIQKTNKNRQLVKKRKTQHKVSQWDVELLHCSAALIPHVSAGTLLSTFWRINDFTGLCLTCQPTVYHRSSIGMCSCNRSHKQGIVSQKKPLPLVWISFITGHFTVRGFKCWHRNPPTAPEQFGFSLLICRLFLSHSSFCCTHRTPTLVLPGSLWLSFAYKTETRFKKLNQ